MPKIEDILKDPAILQNNFNGLTSKSPYEKTAAVAKINNIENLPTTHSFGYEKVFYLDKAKTLTGSVYPAKRILFENQAFYSDQYRNRVSPPATPQPVRTMIKARDYGLDEFVFTYLGVHEYYYSQCEATNVPAFGAFFPAKLDSSAYSNATLYDLESTLAASFKREEITLTTNDARIITVHEVCNKYGHDFFNYWVCQDYIAKDFEDDDKWEQKREFHYYEKVSVIALEAILWPIELDSNPVTKLMEIKPSIFKELYDFGTLYPDIRIFKYIWNAPEGNKRFTYASYLIGLEYYQTGDLISEAKFNQLFYTKFPTPSL